MNIQRTIVGNILTTLQTREKIVIIYGARQVGKTTLAKDVIKQFDKKTLSINADEKKYIDILSSRDAAKIKSLIQGYELIFIDEAQRIPEIGLNLKIIIDQFPNIKVLVTGSSSLDLAHKTKESLVGITITYQLFPFSISELSTVQNPFEIQDSFEDRMVFGSYPELWKCNNIFEKKQFLEELSHAYLYKDVLEIATIKYPDNLRKLLQLLAFQIGQEVSLTEVGKQIGMGKDTVAHYIDLLEKSFVIFRLSGFSRNLRKEVSKMDKIYFYDLGVRNVLIDNLKPLEMRNDGGALWENFFISERIKLLRSSKTLARSYYWRTYTGAKIDYIEERDGVLHGYEIKQTEKKVKVPNTWKETYESSTFSLIHRENAFNFLLEPNFKHFL